ncbi:MAG: hypothetical protein ABI680_06040, partial [Chthoniobacteraceae bacterium]
MPYPWTEDTADDEDESVANLGQIKRVFAFDLSGFVFPPNPAAANPLPLNRGILFNWSAVPRATGYRIESRRPGGPPPLDLWTLRAEVSAGNHQWWDGNATPNVTYAYRAFAKRGATISAATNEALAVMPLTPLPEDERDSDGDGTPDVDEDRNVDTDG